MTTTGIVTILSGCAIVRSAHKIDDSQINIFSGSIQKNVLTAVTCFRILWMGALVKAPAAEANKFNRELRRENRQLRRVVRQDRRDWRRYRSNGYSNGRFGGYRPLRPAYAYGYGNRNGGRYYRPSGFHVLIRL